MDIQSAQKAYRIGKEARDINACIGAAQALYHWATHKDRTYVGKEHFPDFQRLDDVARDARDERDILTKKNGNN